MKENIMIFKDLNSLRSQQRIFDKRVVIK